MNEQAVMTPGQRSALHSVARDLHHKYEGKFGVETIEALVLDSFDELSRTASVTRWLVLSARRFAEQRLKALVHAEDRSAQGPRGAVPMRPQRGSLPNGAGLVLSSRWKSGNRVVWRLGARC